MPAPFGPMSPTHSPRSTENETPSTTLRLPSSTVTLLQPKRRHTEAIRLEVRRTTAKNGAPKNAVTTPIGSSPGESAVRAITSANTRKPASDKHRKRQEQPVARADDEADRVWDDDSDKPDQTADRDRGRRADGRADDDHEPHAADVHAEARSLVVADAEHVEEPAVQRIPTVAITAYGRSVFTSVQSELGSEPRIHE